MTHTARLLALSAGLGLAAACTDIQSDSLLTSGMNAQITGETTGDGATRVAAVLRSGGELSNVFVELTGDDALSATRDGVEQPMVRESLGTYHQYVATFDGADPGVEITVSLSRTVDAGAPATTLALPEPFTLGEVSDFSRAEDLVVTWDPSGLGDTMAINIDGSCIFSYTESISGDPGTWTIPGGTLSPIDDTTEESCSVDIDVTRSRAGTLDPAYGEGGAARGVQRRRVTVLSQP